VEHARRRFEKSPLVARFIPPEVRARALGGFEAQGIINHIGYVGVPVDLKERMKMVDTLMTTTSLHAPIEWLLGSDSDIDRILGELSPAELQKPELAFYVGVHQFATRHFEDALHPLEIAEGSADRAALARLLRTYALSH
jgi:hypothetical protein